MLKKPFYFFLFITVYPFSIMAQKNYTALLDEYMDGFNKAHDFSGVVFIEKNGKKIYTKAFGEANREWKIPNTIDTRFQIASVTKQFTAVAILKLVEQGKLQMDDKVSKFFPGYPKGDSITIHMLLNHTSGIYNYLENPALDALNPNISIKLLKDSIFNLFKNKPFDFSPGTFWRYSNSGYVLLGYIIEQVSGETYRDYIYKNLLLPASMMNTDLYSADSIIPFHSNGYIKTSQGWKPKDIIAINAAFSAGGLFSTVGDLSKWCDALYTGKIINKESLSKMNQPNAGERGYGYGVFVDSFFNRRAIFHSGSLTGFTSLLMNYPVDGIRIIILTNRNTNIDFLPRGLAAMLFDQNVIPPYKHIPIKIDPSILKRYVGKFVGKSIPFPLNIINKNNKLYLQLGTDMELVPESENKFYISEQDVEIGIEFELNDKKEVVAVYFIESGVKIKVKMTIDN